MTWELVYIISGALFLPVLIWAIIASIRVTVTIDHYHQIKATGNLTARDLVKKIATENQLNIRVEATDQGDHYDPTAKVVRLSHKVIDSDSVSALAIAAHECGHALQDAENYAPLRLRNFVIRLSNFTSRLLTPLIIISVIASLFIVLDVVFEWMLIGFCVVYGLSALVSLITLPTEFDASRRGKKLLDSLNIVETNTERQGVDQVLRAAANTYVVAFALSVIYFLRYLSYFMIFFGHDRD